MNRKENWIDATLEGGNYIDRVQSDEQLINRLKSIPIGIKKDLSIYIPKKTVFAAAASIILLISVNFYSSIKYKSVKNESISENTELTNTYFSYLKQL